MSVKWGVLGTAGIARGCTIPGMLKAEGCKVYAIAGRDEKKTQFFKEQFGFEKAYVGYDKLLADEAVDAVYIPLPNDIHYEWVMKAIDAGKHVLCEKPLALNAAEAEEMYAAAEAKGVILAEAYAYLHSPYVKQLKEDVESGVIGQIDYIESAFITQGYKEDFRLHKEFGGGAMYDLGCYCTTMMLTLVDAEPVSVQALAEMSEEGVDLFTSGYVKFDNGVRGSFSIGMMLGTNTNARFDRLYIHGSKGCIKSDVEYNQEGELSYSIYVDGRELVRHVNARQNYSLEIEQMNRAIRGLEKPHVSAEFSVRNAKLIDAVLKEIGY